MRLLALLLLAASAWGYTCTSTAVGTNASNVMHWTGCNGTTPQPGDFAIIATTTIQDLDLDIGNSPASTTVDNTTSALRVNASLTVAPGVTLRVRGHVHHGNAPVVFQGGSALACDATGAASPSTTKYMWYTDGFSAGSRSLTFSGVVGNKVNVYSQSGGGNCWFSDKSGYTDGMNVSATYTNFTRIGDTVNPSFKLTNSSPNTWLQYFTHCHFDTTGLFRVNTINTSTGGGYGVYNNTWANSLGLPNGDGLGAGHVLAVSIGGTTANVPGTHDFIGNVVDKLALITVSGNTKVEDNIFLGNQYWAAATTSNLASFQRNFIHFPDKTYARNEAGNTVNNYYVHTVPESSQVWTGTYVSHVNSGNQMVITVSGPAMTAATMQSNGSLTWDLHLESGAGVDEVRAVRTNGTNTFTVDGRWRSGKAPSAGDTISVYTGNGGNIHWFVSNTYLTSWLVDGIIIDLQNTDNNGDWGAKPSGSPNAACATIVQNSIFLPNAQRSNASPMFVTLGQNFNVGYPTYYVSLIRNTGFAGFQSCGHVGEQGQAGFPNSGYPDQWHEIRDNICYSDPGALNNVLVGGSTNTQPNYWLSDWVAGSYTPADYAVNLATTHHNATWGLAAGRNGGGYDVHPASAVYNTTDVSADPQFLDDERNIFRWGKSLGLTGTRTHIINATLAAMAKRNDDDFDSRFTLSALQAYVRAGFAPQNSALMASSTGGWIGAVDGGSPPPPPPSRSTICNRCTLSGGAQIKAQ